MVNYTDLISLLDLLFNAGIFLTGLILGLIGLYITIQKAKK